MRLLLYGLSSIIWVCSSSVLAAEELAERSSGEGLSVSPGGLLIQHVVPGEVYDFAEQAGVLLTVSHRGVRTRTYQLTAHAPSVVGNGKWLSGYDEIPDASWLTFEPTELTIEPDGEAVAKMYLRVPEGTQYENQHWVVSVGIRGKPQPGETLALAAYPRYQIETEPRIDHTTVLDGALGLQPSLLQFDKIPLNTSQEGQIIVRNGDAAPHRYQVSVRTISADPTREQIIPSPGYSWLPDTDWVAVEEEPLVIKAKQHQIVSVKVNIPQTPAFAGKNWEALLWIAPDEGKPRFARIQVVTMGAESQE